MLVNHENEGRLSRLVAEIPALQQAWASVQHHGYAANYQALSEKSEALVTAFRFFRDADTLDIGCNSGLYTYILSIFCKSVTGVDPDAKLISRAEAGRAHLQRRKILTNNISFSNKALKDIATANYNSILAACVLYHLSAEEIDLLQDVLAERIQAVLIQVRPDRLAAFQRGQNKDYPSRHNRHGGLFTVEDNVAFLRKTGFKDILVFNETRAFFNERFPVIYAFK